MIRDRESEPPHWFRGELAAAYLAPPVALALVSFTANKDAIFWPTMIGLVGVSMPPLVHSLEGDSTGALYSLAGMVGASGAGALSGVAIGHLAPGDTTHERAEQRDAAVFGLLGYSLWALIDVAFFAVVAPPSQRMTATFVPAGATPGLLPSGVERRLAGAI
jgi:hypothetical protein